MTIRIGAVELEHPLLNASGTLDALAAAAAGVPVHADVAALVTKTITAVAARGEPAASARREPVGPAQLDRPREPRRRRVRRGPAGARRARPSARRLDRRLRRRRLRPARGGARAGRRGVVALELNISCPNVETGCSSIGSDPAETANGRARMPRGHLATALGEALAERGRRLRDRRGRPSARAPTRSCASTRCAAWRSRPWSGRPLLGAGTGGLSGPALKPVALAAVWTCASACALPIVGVGGVLCGRDALDLLDAGATAVQVGTALFRDPRSDRADTRRVAGACGEPPLSLDSWSRVSREPRLLL